MGKRYQGRMDVNMMGDYCWMLKRDNVHTGSRKRSGRSIKNNKKDFATKCVINKHFLSFLDSTRKIFELLKVPRATEKEVGRGPTVGQRWSRYHSVSDQTGRRF